MKKILLLLFSLIALPVFAYQTVLVDFPVDEHWHPVLYQVQGNESILQYVPGYQDEKNWTRAIFFHAYGLEMSPNANSFLDLVTSQMQKMNPVSYRYTKYTPMDSIATRCIKSNGKTPTQCEILRASRSFEKMITMQYVNKNTADFKKNYSYWYNIVKNIRIYQSYYREDRVMDKATSFEL